MCVIKYFMYLSMNLSIYQPPPVSDLFYSQQENVCMCWYEFRAINAFFCMLSGATNKSSLCFVRTILRYIILRNGVLRNL